MKHLRWMALPVALCLIESGWAQKMPVDPEIQLQAIRQAVVDATMDKSTKVSATAWVDDQGRLHESAHFQTDARIKGIRVLSYTEQGDRAPKAKVELEDLPWVVKVAKARPGEVCEPAPQIWKQHLAVVSHLSSGFSGPERYASQALLKQMTLTWKELGDKSGRWRIENTTSVSSEAYQRHWLGQGEDQPGWQLQIQLLPIRTIETSSAVQGWALWSSAEAPKRWSVRVTLGQKTQTSHGAEPQWTRELQLDVPSAALSSQPDHWVKQSMLVLSRVFDDWMKDELSASTCDPAQFHVSRLAGQGWVLQAGMGSGLKTGDRVLIVNSSKVPGRLLEPGNSQQMVIAEVTRVGRRQSELKPLAGSAPNGPGVWIALPL